MSCASHRDSDIPELSFAQQRLWLVDQLTPGNAAYLTARFHRLTGKLDIEALERAVRHVWERHRVLRTRIVMHDGRPRAVVGPPQAVPFVRCDVSTDAMPETRATQLAADLGFAPMDLTTGPLFRAGVVRIGLADALFWYTAHHLVFDGVSRLIVEQEISEAYDAFRAGRVPQYRPPAADYFDYVAAQRLAAADPDTVRQLSYWRGRLAGMPPTLELPTDFERPEAPSMRGADVEFEFGSTAMRRLAELAQTWRTTPFVITLALYQALLGFHAGVRDVAVGVPFAGRAELEFEGVVGLFVNMVVQRGDLRGDPPVSDLIGRTRESVLEAIDYQDVPFELVVDELRGGGDAARNALFQHSFHWSDDRLPLTATGGGLTLEDVQCAMLEFRDLTARFDLELHLWAAGDRLTGQLTYSTDLFTEPTAARLAARYRDMVERLVVDPGVRVSKLVSLSDPEQQRLLELGRESPAPAAPDWTVVSVFDRTAETMPDAVAVVSGAQRLTYRQLKERAEDLALALRRRGIGRESVVAVVLPRGTELVSALLGVLKSGAAYLPIDVHQPEARIAGVLRDARAALILTTSELAAELPRNGPPTMPLAPWPAGGERAPLPAPTLGSLCYVIFTSGSTGTPKAVAVTHRSLSNLVAWHLRRYRLGAEDRILQVASISFDAATWEIWPPLVAGATLDVAEDGLVRSPEGLAVAFGDRGTTVSFVPTPVAEQLIALPLRGMRVLLTGGDVFHPRAADDPGIAVVNHYGPTENTVVATASAPLRAPWSHVSLGRPIDGVYAYVLDHAYRLLPAKTVGELYLGGRGVARGYLHRPRATAEGFLPDPFGTEPGARMYRTGDLVRWRPDGTLHFVGRADRQIKIRGHRIEPAEIEANMLAHPGVRTCAVTAVEPEAGRPMLVGYHAPAIPIVTADDLRRHLRERLPDYMVPSVFVPLDELPLNVSGKVDRARLPPAEVAAPAHAAPHTESERTVTRLWQEVLGTDRVGVDDDFFAIGGTSMSAARLAVRMQETFGVELPLRDVFELRTVSALTQLAEERVRAAIAAMSPQEIANALGGASPGAA